MPEGCGSFIATGYESRCREVAPIPLSIRLPETPRDYVAIEESEMERREGVVVVVKREMKKEE